MSSCSPLSFPLPLSLYRFHSLPPFLFLTQAECSLGLGKGLWRSVISWLHEHAKYTLGYQCSRNRWIEIKTIFEEELTGTVTAMAWSSAWWLTRNSEEGRCCGHYCKHFMELLCLEWAGMLLIKKHVILSAGKEPFLNGDLTELCPGYYVVWCPQFNFL